MHDHSPRSDPPVLVRPVGAADRGVSRNATGRNFSSDNITPAAPEIIDAVNAANIGLLHSYGDTRWPQERLPTRWHYRC